MLKSALVSLIVISVKLIREDDKTLMARLVCMLQYVICKLVSFTSEDSAISTKALPKLDDPREIIHDSKAYQDLGSKSLPNSEWRHS